MRILMACCGGLGTETGLRFAAAGHKVVGWRRSPGQLPAAIDGVAVNLGSGNVPPLPPETTVVVALPPAGNPGHELDVDCRERTRRNAGRMRTDRLTPMDIDLWPHAPELPAPVIMGQHWKDAVFLHWRIPEAIAAKFMPAGVVPDGFDGSAWVGLIGFRMEGAAIGRGPGIPYFGSFNEINVRLYSREPGGTRGVVFLTLDAARLAVVVTARAAGIPYVWSQDRFRAATPADPSTGYSVRRFRGGARSDFAVTPAFDDEASDPLSIHLTARFGLHTRFRGNTLYVPNTHAPWPLYRASVTVLEDQLIRAAGIEVSGPPESVLFSPGVYTQFGRPRGVKA